MIIVTTPTVTGSRIVNVLGVVQGNTVRARHIGRDIVAALRNVVGGEIGQYSQLFTDAREEAMGRMVQQAQGLGANAVVNLRFATSMIMNGASEVLAYGTAVVIEPGAGPARES